jgi:2-iminobutanoate/2-iminopropanoate deaminase
MVPGGIAEQTEQVLHNVANILEAAGSDTRSVVRSVVYLRSMADFAEMNRVYARFFGAHRPARSTIAVSELPQGALIEIEVTAAVTIAKPSEGSAE